MTVSKGDLRKMPRSHIFCIVLGCVLLSCGVISRETEDEFAEFEFDLPGEEEEGMILYLRVFLSPSSLCAFSLTVDFDVGEVEEEEEEARVSGKGDLCASVMWFEVSLSIGSVQQDEEEEEDEEGFEDSSLDVEEFEVRNPSVMEVCVWGHLSFLKFELVLSSECTRL